jgi:hypothetical protein
MGHLVKIKVSIEIVWWRLKMLSKWVNQLRSFSASSGPSLTQIRLGFLT